MADTPKKAGTVPKDYRELRLSLRETVLSFAAFALAGALLGYIFYQNLIIAGIGCLAGLWGPKAYRRYLIDKRAKALSSQFKDMLQSLSASMSAGMTLHYAMHAAYEDLRNLYFDDNTLILVEMRGMLSQIDRGMSEAEAIDGLAQRSHDEDILSFANVLKSTQDSGVDMARLIKRTVGIISEKIEVQQEIATSVASMKMEQRIMSAMPVLIMLFVNLGSPGYMAPLYASPMGYLLITVALAILVAAMLIAGKITNIKI